MFTRWLFATLLVMYCLPAPASAIGPSFDCGKANTPLAQFVCSDPDLSKIDLLFVRPYFALRQLVGPTGWQSLKQEAITFQAATERECGISASDPLPSNRAVLKTCIQNAYVRQMTAWRYRLSGPALEEAARSIEQHIALQAKLQETGFLLPTEIIDGVYGASTRTAIQSWQGASGLKVTGFLGNDDAQRLTSSSAPAATPPSQPRLAQTRGTEPPAATRVQQAPPPVPIPSMDIVDFLVDGRDFVGRKVTITGCEFRYADMSTVSCSTQGGHVQVDSRSLERESFRRALRNCAGYAFDQNPDCTGDVTGQVSLGDVRGLSIADSVIKWSTNPEAPTMQQSSPARSAPSETTLPQQEQAQRPQEKQEAQRQREQEQQEPRPNADVEELARNKAAAAKMGVSLVTYLWAKPGANTFYLWCQERVASNAMYGSRKDWLPNFTWAVNKNRSEITVSGQDVQLKNAFGTLYYVQYTCVAIPGSPDQTQSDDPFAAWKVRVASVVPLHGGG